MGITLAFAEQLRQRGFLAPGCKVLDIGPSNLYQADEVQIQKFASQYGKTIPADAVSRIAKGSSYGPNGTLNESFVGELFERVGIEYHSIDIAQGYNTEVVDLNTQNLPKQFVGRFDLVMNLGTTEHIVNQMACFRAIHDATKVGGVMFHQLPALGWLDHCYFTYTGRFFFDLASYNQYEILGFHWTRYPQDDDMNVTLRSYQQAFPALADYLASEPQDEDEKFIRNIITPSVSANIALKRATDRPFMAALEVSTSIGDIPTWVHNQYYGQLSVDDAAGINQLPVRVLASEIAWRAYKKARRAADRVKQRLVS